MANIGDRFRTCQEAPESGVYRWVRCDTHGCSPTEEEREIREHFPPCKSCGSAAVWELIRKA